MARHGRLETFALIKGEKLLVGEMASKNCIALGVPREGPPEQIPANEWPYFAIFDGDSGLFVQLANNDGNEVIDEMFGRYKTRYEDVRVSRAELVKTFPATPPKKKPRKTRYDWPAFIEEAIRQLEDEGNIDPGSDPDWIQADLERRMLVWCEATWGKEPSESGIRMKVSDALSIFHERLKAG